MMFKAVTALCVAFCAQGVCSAALISGWDTWVNTGTPVGATTASQTAPGVTASALPTPSASALGGPWSSFSDGRGASTDGTFGSLASPAASTASGTRPDVIGLVNNREGLITFTVDNSAGTDDIDLSAFHFDSYARRPRAARSFELTASGDVTNGAVFTSAPQVINHTGGNISDTTIHDEFDIDLSGLADSTLEAGGTATFTLSFFGAVAGTGGHDLYLDNVAISGELAVDPPVVPEPTSLALLVMVSAAVLSVKSRR